MCNCREEIEARLLECAKGDVPEGAKDLSVSLKGYGFAIVGNRMEMRNVMRGSVDYQAPVKKHPGTFRQKSEPINIVGSYCMFCGEKYQKDEQPS